MKYRMNLLILLICPLLLLFGCKHESVDDPSDKFSGYWECVRLSVNGKEYSDVYSDEMGFDLPVYAFYDLALANDGTGYICQPIDKIDHETAAKQAFTWKKDNDSVTLCGSENSSMTLDYADGQLVFKPDESTCFWFGKVSKFTDFDPDQWLKKTEEAKK